MTKIPASGLLAANTLAASAALADPTIRFAFVDIDGMDALQRDKGLLREAFEAASGLKVEFFPVSGRTVAVKSMAVENMDFVPADRAEYAAFNARLDALPVVTWKRPDYFSTQVVLDESQVKPPADLKRQKVSFVECEGR